MEEICGDCICMKLAQLLRHSLLLLLFAAAGVGGFALQHLQKGLFASSCCQNLGTSRVG